VFYAQVILLELFLIKLVFFELVQLFLVQQLKQLKQQLIVSRRLVFASCSDGFAPKCVRVGCKYEWTRM
jgi:hypothetical protein